LPGSCSPSTPRWLLVSLAVALLLTIASPIAAVHASTNLSSGDAAVIADANGDNVRLRATPGASGAILAEFPEGTEVEIVDGPTPAADGTNWYKVTVSGQTGYMVADYLSLEGEGLNGATPVATEPPTETATPADGGDIELAALTGSATIVNTNGDRIRCRASRSTRSAILGYFSEGDSVSLTGDPSGTWQPVRCAGRNGWVSVDFISGLAADEPTPTETAVASATTGTGTISGTNGDGARCRSKASTDGAIITVLAEGTAVGVRGSQSGDWLPVVCANRNGYIWADYVSLGSDNGGGGGSNDGGDTSGTRVIANTGGDGIRCRKKASLDGEILTVLVAGDEVALRGAVKGDWQPVTCDGMKGYVHKEFLAVPGDGSSDPEPTPAPTPSSSLQSGDTAKVSGTNGDGVRFRSGASTSASVIQVLGEGTTVDVIDGSSGDWVAVAYQGTDGFIHSDYLVKADGNGSAGGSHDALADGDHAMVTASLNFRSGPSQSADVIGIAMDGIVVLITGPRDNGYFPVEWGDQDGFMHGDYLEWTSDDLSPGYGGVGGDAGSDAPSAAGQAIVDYAMGYLGYPYVWATHGPDSFDCSGFTYWVVKHVLHKDIGAGLWTQIVAGTPVSYGNLQPGDLVFFQNTYTWGLSHVGIYIGNNQFINAENEDTGVRISSLTSTYYSTRYYGAVRLS
jgi:uncharacterized protein YgiM (DUF1202 family)